MLQVWSPIELSLSSVKTSYLSENEAHSVDQSSPLISTEYVFNIVPKCVSLLSVCTEINLEDVSFAIPVSCFSGFPIQGSADHLA